MSHFQLPKSFCQKMDVKAATFIWGEKDDGKRIRWVTWNKMCVVKGVEGLGSNASWGWRSLLQGLELIKHDLIWHIGNGRGIRIWEDSWVVGCPNFKIQYERPSNCNLHYVSELLVQSPKSWNISLIRSLFSEAEVNTILSIPLPWFEVEDNSPGFSQGRQVYSKIKLS
uniref:Uncharacterized protein n=1 Tax=Nelumbo nucifera TaxID=4432 RepID=A0A822Z4L6_NELNU|nr:TPA_asm: hypothetical protein HUJ06_015597 [Nelumbo nucifera]